MSFQSHSVRVCVYHNVWGIVLLCFTRPVPSIQYKYKPTSPAEAYHGGSTHLCWQNGLELTGLGEDTCFDQLKSGTRSDCRSGSPGTWLPFCQVVAEYAVAHALRLGMRTIYTSPIKVGGGCALYPLKP